ncbi:VanW family protein [Caldanaerobacter sp.]|uniref:VanW family protein n=1 Tax=Caldanaerobacter sp. TaxID=2930036 RepID=UPI003C76A9E9
MQAKGGSNKNKKRNYFYLIVALALAVAFSFVLAYFYVLLNSSYIAKGVFIEGLDVGGMEREEALNLLKEKFKIPNFTIMAVYEGEFFEITSEDIGLYYDYEETVNRAYQVGREGNILERVKEIYTVGKEGKNFTLSLHYERKALDAFVKKIAEKIDKDPENASIRIVRGVKSITPEKPGVKVNKEETLKRMLEEIETAIEGRQFSKIEVPVAFKKILPQITKSMLDLINGRISTFSTVFNAEDVNRSDNLVVASRAIDGTLLLPGEVFSLNKALGPRVIERGYKEAPVIIDNKLVPALGGGICQVATTLYNAVLRADITIVERYHHSFPVAYVPPGQDATISGDVLDLKFKNSTNYPIYIESYIEGNKLFINIYGHVKNPSRWVDIQSEIVEKYEPEIKYVEDPNLPEGETVEEIKPQIGYKVNVYRLIYENGKLVKKEFLYKDLYKPVDGVIKKGTKKMPKGNTSSNLKPVDSVNPIGNIPSQVPPEGGTTGDTE